MNFKKWWKKLDYWKKGGIIGFLVPIVPFMIGVLLSYVRFFSDNSLNLLITDIFYFIPGIFSHIFGMLIDLRVINCSSEACTMGAYHTLILLASPIIYAILGATIGFIITKKKKR